MFDEFITLIKEVGFPIAVASFVLFRLNGKLDRLTVALRELIIEMKRHRDEED